MTLSLSPAYVHPHQPPITQLSADSPALSFHHPICLRSHQTPARLLSTKDFLTRLNYTSYVLINDYHHSLDAPDWMTVLSNVLIWKLHLSILCKWVMGLIVMCNLKQTKKRFVKSGNLTKCSICLLQLPSAQRSVSAPFWVQDAYIQLLFRGSHQCSFSSRW